MYSMQLALQIDPGISPPKASYMKKITSSEEKYIYKKIINIYQLLPVILCEINADNQGSWNQNYHGLSAKKIEKMLDIIGAF